MQVIDTFLFDNETDLLNLRFKVLSNHVDWFVLCENKYTFQGKEKPYHSMDLDLPGNCRVVRIEYKNDDVWKVENAQRDALMNGVIDIARSGDWILHGDVDELPDLDKVDFNIMPAMFTFQMPCFYYYWNLYGKQWLGTLGTRYPFALSLSKFRHIRNAVVYRFPAGWHFAWSGGVEAIRHKIKSFSHTELNRPDILEHLDEYLKSGILPWNDDDIKELKRVKVSAMPLYVQGNEAEYRQKGLLL